MRFLPLLVLFLGLVLPNAPGQPNVVLIVADDLGFSDLGCYGGEIQTPNLDQLAAEGLRFTQFYNCAVCNATRAAMLTGVNPRFGKGGYLRSNMVTAAEALKGAGYATAMSGKWHLGGAPTRPIDRGFQEYYGVMIGAVNQFDPTLPDPPPMKHSGPPNPFVHNAEPIRSVPADYYTTDAFTDHAVRQIKTLSKGGKPFFLHLAYTAPHYPLQARPEDIAKYKGRYAEGYGALRKARHQRLVEKGLIKPEWFLPEPDEKQSEWRYDVTPQPWLAVEDKGWEAAKMEVYAAMVDRVDQGIGRVMAALKERGIEDETLIVFFSDNGGCGSQSSGSAHRAYQRGEPVGDKQSYILGGPGWATAQSSPFRRFKTWTYEGGITTPFIVRWKGKVKAGGVTHQVGHVVDLLPTFLEIAGVDYPAQAGGGATLPLEGKSLKPVWLDGEDLGERELGWYLFGGRAYRSGKWKIVRGPGAKSWELYDMEEDRTETRDLSGQHPELVAKLTKAWQRWAVRSEVP